jgi:hypothetical protein
MTTTLTRPETQQPVVEAAPTANRFPITLLVAVAVLATAILVGQVATSPAVDGSHEVAEFGRQTALAPVDNSHDVAEFARQTALGAVVSIDGSHQIAETGRMTRLAPVVDDSFERNEAEWQAALGG